MSELTRRGRSVARDVANNNFLEGLARFGFLGYGLTHLLVGWLALQIAFGRSSQEGDQTGAMRTLAGQPLGRFVLVAVCVGLSAMAVWQALEAAVGHRDVSGGTRAFERVASVGRAVVYGWLAYTAAQVVANAAGSSAGRQQSASATLMSTSGGRWFVGLVGIAVLGLGAGLVIYGLKRRFERHLRTGAMSARTRRLARRLGVAGYVAKGVAYGTAGALVLSAALTYDPRRARGLDAALHTLARQPYGPVLLTLIAAGLAAFALYCVIQARYRKV